MRRSIIDVDFVEPLAPGRWANLGLVLLLTVAVAIWGVVGWQSLRRHKVERELHAAKVQLEQLKQAATETRPALPPYHAAAWEVWKRGRFTASEGLAALEAIPHPGIAIQSIEVDNDAGTLKVELLAVDHDAVERFIDGLNAGLPVPIWRLNQASSHANGLRALLGSRW